MDSVGSGWDGLPAWLCAHRANGIKGVFTGRRKEAGGFSGAQKPRFMRWEWEARLLGLARRKLGASGELEAQPCRLPAAGQGLGGVCLHPERLLPSGWGLTLPDTHPALPVLGGLQRHVCLLEVAAKEIKIKNKVPDSLGGSLVGEELMLWL